ncbi:hypothetical protein D9758_014081 [Tetrapyrgos nigripes]|uniref:Uncharacterized protein n=1 Tax=Tetrapyrgos nigripes TaxID=182062 RepID=A0A8H5CHY1_9AGAR|nr:hypothetical protein D9758_014081 [Tetrapyrgos nigripes]
MASTPTTTTPAHSHPLAPDADTPHSTRSNRSRRNRVASSHDLPSSSSSISGANTSGVGKYFTLKAQLEKEQASGNSTWDGSVRRLGKANGHGHGHAETRKSLDVIFDKKLHTTPSKSSLTSAAGAAKSPRQAPLIIVGGLDPNDNLNASASTTTDLATSVSREVGLDSAIASKVLATKWHEYSDEAIQAAISSFATSESPAEVSSHPYHSALRVLSSALGSLSRARMELEQSRRALMEKEEERRKRAEELMDEHPNEHDVVSRVIQRIFVDENGDSKELVEDDDVSVLEGNHRVSKQKSFMVCLSIIFVLYCG